MDAVFEWQGTAHLSCKTEKVLVVRHVWKWHLAGACLTSQRWRLSGVRPAFSGCCIRHYDAWRTYVHHTISWRMITINNPGTRDTHQQDLPLDFDTNVPKIWAGTAADSWSNVSSSNVRVCSFLAQRIFGFLCQAEGRTRVTVFPFLSPL